MIGPYYYKAIVRISVSRKYFPRYSVSGLNANLFLLSFYISITYFTLFKSNNVNFHIQSTMMQVCVRRGVLCSLRRALSVRCLSAAPAPQIDSDGGVAAVPDHVLSIADQICALSLHETGQLTK